MAIIPKKGGAPKAPKMAKAPGSKKGLFLVMNVALIVLIFAASFMFIQTSINNHTIFIYKTDMKAGEKISQEDLNIIEFPAEKIKDVIPLSPDDVLGKVLKNDVYANEIVFSDHLSDPDKADAFHQIDDMSTYRKIPLEVDMLKTFGGTLMKGDRLDLVYTGQTSAGAEKGTYTKTFIQNALVYGVYDAAGNEIEADKAAQPGTSDELKDQELQEPTIIVLAVPITQAEEIVARSKQGAISLVGRFPGSENVVTLGYTLHGGEPVYTGTSSMESDPQKFNEYNSVE